MSFCWQYEAVENGFRRELRGMCTGLKAGVNESGMQLRDTV